MENENILKKLIVFIIFLITVICIDIGFDGVGITQAGTVVPGGFISSDTTWNISGSPYWIENTVTVEVGATLTIDPGVWVKFRKDAGMHLKVEGNLVAVGTPSQNIHFTSNASSPASKDWGNIWIYSTGSAELEYINVTYGNVAVFFYYASNITLANSKITHCESGTLIHYATNITVIGNNISHCRKHVRLEYSENNTVINNNLKNATIVGIQSTSSFNNKIYHNNIIDNVLQAVDDFTGNYWNDAYPSGGNYWSDWSPITPDLYDGTVTPQTTGFPDGICDNQYDIDADSVDYYPLKEPWGLPPPDTEPPTIEDITFIPDPQEVYNTVNISAIIGDNVQVGGVWINITDPNSATLGNFSMDYDIGNDRYFNSSSYSQLGTYQFEIWARDTSGNWNSSVGSFTIQDTTPPSISSIFPDPGIQEVYGNVNVTVAVTDNFNLYGVWINITKPDGSWLNTTMNHATGVNFYNDQSYNQLGVYDFVIWANDTSNNWNFDTGFFTIQDSTLPSITNVNKNPDPQEVFGNVNISATVTDNYDLYGVWFNVTGPDGSSVNLTMDEISGNIFYLNQSYNQVGIYSFTIWSNDTSGNWNSASDFFTIGDAVPPSISNVTVEPEVQEIYNTVKISAIIIDNHEVSNVTINIRYPDGSTFNLTMLNESVDMYAFYYSFDMIGIYNFTIWAEDASGNWNFSVGSFVMEEYTPPNINNVGADPDVQGLMSFVNISAQVMDNYALYSVWVNVTKPDGSSINMTMDPALSAVFFYNQSYGQIGIYNYTIWANDTSNNWNSVSGNFTIIDAGVPIISNIVANPNIQDLYSNVNITATVIDDTGLSGVWINITRSDGSKFNISMNMGEGDIFYYNQSYNQIGVFNFTIWANDTSNNWNFGSGSFIIEDTIPPSIDSIMVNPDIQNPNKNVNVTTTVIENYELTGVWINITMPNGTFLNVTMNESLGNVFYLNNSYTQTGIYDFTIWARDTSDNWDSESDMFTIFDPTIPQATAEISSPYWKNDGTIAVLWSASDNTGLVNITLQYRYSPDNISWGTWAEYSYNDSVSGTSASGTFQFTAPEDGYYQFFINVSDIDDNWEPDALNAEAMVAIDSVQPSSSVSISPYWNTLSSLIINIATGDSLPSSGSVNQITYYRYSANNVSWGDWEEFEGDDREGYYEFYSIAYDYAGNTELKATSEASCAIDNSPPVAEAGEDRIINLGTTIYFDGSGSSDIFGIIENYTWLITEDGKEVVILYGLSPSIKFENSGEFVVTLTIRDYAGNIDEDTIAISVDSGPPVITPWVVPMVQEVHGIVNITAEVTDNIGVFGVWVQIFDENDHEVENVSMISIGSSDDFYYENTYSIVGSYTYTIWANDTLNNWALSQDGFEIRDTTSPTAYSPGDRIVNISELINFDGSTSTDNVGIVNYTWEIYLQGNLIATLYGREPNYIFKEAGIYDVTFTVKDAEGNSDNALFQMTVSSPEKEQTDYMWLILVIVLLIVVLILIAIFKSRKEEPQEVELDDLDSTESISELEPSEEKELPPPPETDLPPPPPDGENA